MIETEPKGRKRGKAETWRQEQTRERVPNNRKKNRKIDRERKRGGSSYKVREKL